MPTKKALATILGVALFSLVPLTTSAQGISDLQAQVQALLAQIAVLQQQLAAMQSSSGSTQSPQPTQKTYWVKPGYEAKTCAHFEKTDTYTVVGSRDARCSGSRCVSPAFYWFPSKDWALAEDRPSYLPSDGMVNNIQCSEKGGEDGVVITRDADGLSNSIAPAGATVPVMRITANNSSRDLATLNGVIVERTGLSSDAAVSLVVLRDLSTGQVVKATLNSNHQARLVTPTIGLASGEKRQFELSLEMAQSVAADAGKTISLAIVALEGTNLGHTILPVTGVTHTVNNALVTGSATVELSQLGSLVFVPGAAQQMVASITIVAGNVEPIRVPGIRLMYNDSAPTDPVNCRAYDGASVLTTGNHIVNVAGTGERDFTFDTPLVLQKGEEKRIHVRCDIPASATKGAFSFTLGGGEKASFPVVGETYGFSFFPSVFANPESRITIAGGSTSSGALTMSTDPSSPAAMIVTPGSGASGPVIGAYRFHANGEDVMLDTIALKLTSGTSASISKAELYDAAGTLHGTAIFAGNNLHASSTLSSPIRIPKDTDVQVIVRGTLTQIGAGHSGVPGALVRVDAVLARGTGSSSGAQTYATGGTGVAGVIVQKALPTVTLDALSTEGLADGKLMRFKVMAGSSGPVSFAAMAFRIDGLAQGVNGQVDLRVYTDANYSTPVSYCTTSDCHDPSVINGLSVKSGSEGGTMWFPKPLVIPAGAIYYFELRDSWKGTGIRAQDNRSPIQTTLLGESGVVGVVTVPSLVGKDVAFVWSPNSKGNSVFAAQDWTNGYLVPGLPSNGISQTRTGFGGGVSTVPPVSSCQLDGAIVPSGSQYTFYSQKTVPFGQNCGRLSQTRTCTNGVLSGSAAHQYSTCTVATASSCTLDGKTVENGAKETFYREATLPFGSTCKSIDRTCKNGVLSGSAAYASATCVVGAAASCSQDGVTVESGTSRTFYRAASVPTGGTCASQERKCTNGKLSGSYTFASCTVAAPDPNALPKPSITATPTFGVSPVTVSFALNRGICDGNWYRINYGDGTTEDLGACAPSTTDAQIAPHEHTYTKAGTFTARLYVSKNTGKSYAAVGGATASVKVRAPSKYMYWVLPGYEAQTCAYFAKTNSYEVVATRDARCDGGRCVSPAYYWFPSKDWALAEDRPSYLPSDGVVKQVLCTFPEAAAPANEQLANALSALEALLRNMLSEFVR